MYEPNPFCVQEGKVAMDRSLSFNSILSKYIYRYINIVNYYNSEANIEEFINFFKAKL